MTVVLDMSLTDPAKDIGTRIQAVIFANPGETFRLKRGGDENDRIIVESTS